MTDFLKTADGSARHLRCSPLLESSPVRRFVPLVLFLALAAPLVGQSPAMPHTPPPADSPLAPLAFLAGDWEGDAWMIMGPEGRTAVRQREWVRWVAGGTVLAIQGVGRLASDSSRVVHDAFATIALGNDRRTVSFRAQTMHGQLDPTFRIVPNGFDWEMVDPRTKMQIHYEMRLDAQGRWVEKGFRTGPTGERIQFFEMTLTRR